jgi:AhpD family alkylhydroperoxidase
MFSVGSLLTMDEKAAAQHHTTGSIFLDKEHPAAWRALNGLGLKAKEAADEAGLDRTLIELLNVRISQINGCAYCLDLHVGDAVKNGESPSAWPSSRPGGTRTSSPRRNAQP